MSILNLLAAAAIAAAPLTTSPPPTRLYVTNQDDATVSVIDLKTHKVVETVDLRKYGFGDNAKPHHVQVEADGSAWYVTLIGAGKVLKFDAGNKLLGSASMEVPGLIALHPTKDLMFVARSMSAVNPPPRLVMIRRSDMKVLDEIDLLFPRPHGVVVHPKGGRVYVASLGTNQIASIGVEKGDVKIIDVPGKAHSFVQGTISPDGRWLVVTAELTDQLMVFDLSDPVTPKLAHQVATPNGPFESVFTGDGRWIFLTALRANQVAVVDTKSWSVVDTITHKDFAQPHGLGLSPDGRYVFVSNRHQQGGAHQHEGKQATGHGTVVAICAANRAVTATTMVGNYAAGLGTPVHPGASAPAPSSCSGDVSVTSPADTAPPALSPITGAKVACTDGKANGYPCERVDLLSYLPPEALGVTDTAKYGRSLDIIFNDIWGWTDAKTGREFVVLGRVDGTSFVEVTDPGNPKYLGSLPMPASAKKSYWRDIKVYKDHAFIVADAAREHGMQVFDLTQLRDVKNAPATFEETARYTGIHSAHNIVINEATGYAYSVASRGGGETCGGALHMIDIRDPKNPAFAGCHAQPDVGRGAIHDAQCVIYRGPDQEYRGKEICLNSSEGAVSIVNVTEKGSPQAVSVAKYPNISYTHQGWLSDDHRYFFVGDETDEKRSKFNTRTIVFDLSDLDDPVVAKEFFGSTAATDHNLYVRGSYMYQANYKAGLQVIDVSDPANPKEVGHFDTTPHIANTAGYAGAWSDYPYFKEDGLVAVSSISEGLFMVRFNPPASGQ